MITVIGSFITTNIFIGSEERNAKTGMYHSQNTQRIFEISDILLAITFLTLGILGALSGSNLIGVCMAIALGSTGVPTIFCNLGVLITNLRIRLCLKE